MTQEVSYSDARQHLADLWDRAIEDREAIRLTRRGKAPVMLVPADEYDGLLETAHLLRSPANAARMLSAIERARRDEGELATIESLRAQLRASEGE